MGMRIHVLHVRWPRRTMFIFSVLLLSAIHMARRSSNKWAAHRLTEREHSGRDKTIGCNKIETLQRPDLNQQRPNPKMATSENPMAEDRKAPWYKASLQAFSERTHTSAKIAERILARAEDIGLPSCQSCVSIGVGTGDADIPLLTNSFCKLRHYTAVEPNTEELVVFKDRLNKLGRTDITVEIVNKRVEDWEGPRDPVDVVLLVGVLYNIEDKVALIKQCLDWLKPGGVLLIAHGGDDNCFVPIVRKFYVADELYTAKDVRADLESMGLKYKEARIVTHFDIRDRNRDVMNFLLQRDATKAEFELLDKYLHKIMPTGQEKQNFWVFWSKKPTCQ